MNPLISIVMPVYNSARFLSRAIESLLAQTYKNIELVIVNDESTDNSWEIIQQYASLDSRIKAYTIPFAKGPKIVRDSGIRRAFADWIVFVDSDDYVDSDCIEKIWNRHLETNADFVGIKMVWVNEEGKELGESVPSSNFDYSVVMSGTEAMLRTLSYWQIGTGGALWNRKVLTNLGKEGAKSDFTDEFDTRVHLNNCSLVAFVDTSYYYTQNTNSCSHKKSVYSLLYSFCNDIKLKSYFDSLYGEKCALSCYYTDRITQLFKQILPELVILCLRSKSKISDDVFALLNQSYSIFRTQTIAKNHILVQYYRLLWLILRKYC